MAIFRYFPTANQWCKPGQSVIRVTTTELCTALIIQRKSELLATGKGGE